MTKAEREEYRAKDLFLKGIAIATEKKDDANHVVRVVLSCWGKYRWNTLVIDNMRIEGEKLGLGSQYVIHEAIVFAASNKKRSIEKIIGETK